MASGLTPPDASLPPHADPLPRADARTGATPAGDGGGATEPQRGSDAPPKKRDKEWAKDQGSRAQGHPVGLARGVGLCPWRRTEALESWDAPLDQLKRDAVTQAADRGPEALEGSCGLAAAPLLHSGSLGLWVPHIYP